MDQMDGELVHISPNKLSSLLAMFIVPISAFAFLRPPLVK